MSKRSDWKQWKKPRYPVAPTGRRPNRPGRRGRPNAKLRKTHQKLVRNVLAIRGAEEFGRSLERHLSRREILTEKQATACRRIIGRNAAKQHKAVLRAQKNRASGSQVRTRRGEAGCPPKSAEPTVGHCPTLPNGGLPPAEVAQDPSRDGASAQAEGPPSPSGSPITVPQACHPTPVPLSATPID